MGLLLRIFVKFKNDINSNCPLSLNNIGCFNLTLSNTLSIN